MEAPVANDVPDPGFLDTLGTPLRLVEQRKHATVLSMMLVDVA